MAKEKHVHQYKKIKKSEIFRCIKPGCRHYLRKEFAIGAISICPRCGGTFQLNNRNMKLEMPHCADCTQRRNQSELEQIKEFMEKIS